MQKNYIRWISFIIFFLFGSFIYLLFSPSVYIAKAGQIRDCDTGVCYYLRDDKPPYYDDDVGVENRYGGGGGGCTPSQANNYCGGSGCIENAANGWSCPCKYGGTWSGWSACSASCGGGTQTRTNPCSPSQSQACNTQACPTNTPTPTSTFTPTITLGPTATPVPGCPKKPQGDANCDGAVNGADYSFWLNRQCTTGCASANLVADFNGDSQVNDNDYTIWFNNRQ